ncbi:MAG TPA: PIN domain-containing protein [Pirellulaceae bacterium]|nr:PIN domain-containing protein [Pirellulaceae bacterium]
MALIILRCVFMVVAVGIGSYLVTLSLDSPGPGYLPWVAFLGTTSLAGGVIAADVFIPRKQIDIISGVYFGLLVGVLLTYVFTLALQPLLATVGVEARTATQLVLGMVLCYTCISFLLQTKDDFRFIIPYVEFSKEIKGLRPYVLDTSVVIDGRIADLVETNVLDNQLVMPRFVLTELQGIADSGDKLRRARGRRGLDVLNRLRNNEHVDFKIYDRELPEMEGQPVDMKLVLLAKHLEGKVVTGDYNLNKVARLHNVSVINLNDIANSLKPVYLPGETFAVRVVKAGEELGQGVGYLDDGTMIVVEGGRDHIGKEVRISVTSVLQTSAGRMIFGRYLSGDATSGAAGAVGAGRGTA